MPFGHVTHALPSLALQIEDLLGMARHGKAWQGMARFASTQGLGKEGKAQIC